MYNQSQWLSKMTANHLTVNKTDDAPNNKYISSQMVIAFRL